MCLYEIITKYENKMNTNLNIISQYYETYLQITYNIIQSFKKIIKILEAPNYNIYQVYRITFAYSLYAVEPTA